MAKAPRVLLALFVALAVAVAAVVLWGPREPLDLIPVFDAAALPADLDAYLAAREAVVGGVTPGAEKRIVWAGAAGVRTRWAVVYLHGFSATSEEIRPVPDLVAKGLGANLYFARFAGHGLGGERFAGPSVNDWMIDLAEALAIGQRLGERVLVIATSTGGTLAAEAAVQPDLAEQMDGIVFVSPNFGLRGGAGAVLALPYARLWAPWVAGRERCFAPENARHAMFWTTCYPTVALIPMAAVARHAAAVDYSGVTLPAQFLYSRADMDVSPAATGRVAADWGGQVAVENIAVGPGDDPYSHIIAGDTLSSSMSAPVAARVLDWAKGL